MTHIKIQCTHTKQDEEKYGGGEGGGGGESNFICVVLFYVFVCLSVAVWSPLFLIEAGKN